MCDFKQLGREDQSGCFASLDKVYRSGQPCASIRLRLDGSSGISLSIKQRFMIRVRNRERRMMPPGMQSMLLPLTFNDCNENKHHKSSGIAPAIRLQPLTSSSSKCMLLRLSGNLWSFGQLRTRRA